ncbi:MAG: galactokinase family protein, partial [Acidobacteriota bacterium]
MPSPIPKDLETVSGLDRFCDILSRTVSERDLFDPDRPIIITRAPGRLDLMGGIADYSGSLVLQYPIKEATFAAIQASADRTIRIESILPQESTETLVFEASLDDLLAGRKLGSVDDARSFFAGGDNWPAYAVGALVVLANERKIAFEHGVRILIYSEVPQGKGVSSSAAIEVAVMKAVVEQFGIEIESRELALLCQKVENGIVGAPCGVMDQMASACGVENSLIELLCQPAELRGTI